MKAGLRNLLFILPVLLFVTATIRMRCPRR